MACIEFKVSSCSSEILLYYLRTNTQPQYGHAQVSVRESWKGTSFESISNVSVHAYVGTSGVYNGPDKIWGDALTVVSRQRLPLPAQAEAMRGLGRDAWAVRVCPTAGLFRVVAIGCAR